MHLNVEIKARCGNVENARKVLMEHLADFIGTDHQEDIYFNVPEGRMKLRLGLIENSFIFYNRNNESGPKSSEITMMEVNKGTMLREILSKALSIKVVVKKSREIYFIDNVKFHVDEVAGLGNFIEIEAIDKDGTLGQKQLDLQCRHYMNILGIQTSDLIAVSYSDMLLDTEKKRTVEEFIYSEH